MPIAAPLPSKTLTRCALLAATLLMASRALGADLQSPPAATPLLDLLDLLGLTPSAASVDYVRNKTEFQLHTLLTEQRHPKTLRLSETVRGDVSLGLQTLFSVDDDVAARLASLAANPAPVHALSAAVTEALRGKRRVYVYGCGATGRLAKQMESGFWRPFWRRVKADPAIWAKLAPHLPADVEDRLIGEMTGADRALISSLEGFEDLQLIGRRQLADRGIERGDVVIAVTEGGETSSVIGTVLAAHDAWKALPGYDAGQARQHLYFVYNNPDDRLRPFARSRAVLDEPGITKLNLATGPMAITGSTRMQATTIETFVVATALEDAVYQTLRPLLSTPELARVGFVRPASLQERLGRFRPALAALKKSAPALAALTAAEADTYAAGRFSTYFAQQGLISVFIDGTERSPTFRLHPLDTTGEERRKCWFQVWTPAADAAQAWAALLGRPFRGLASDFYRGPFETQIDDPWLRTAALESLKKAGDEQQALYDFSFSAANAARRGPARGDLAVAIVLGDELAAWSDAGSPLRRFARLAEERGARLALLSVGDRPAVSLPGFAGLRVGVEVSSRNDPFGVEREIALKALLNAHSTAVMARLGRVVGNTMTNVSPSNLKLIGRATYLIQSHVNEVLAAAAWNRGPGARAPAAYAEANAVLFDAIDFLKGKQEAGGQTAEVAFSIIRLLESARRGAAVPREEALALTREVGLERYLAQATAPAATPARRKPAVRKPAPPGE